MGAMASQITSLTIVYSTVYSRRRSEKHQSSALLAFMWGIHRGPVNSPHKRPVTRKMSSFDDVIMWKRGQDYRPFMRGIIGLRIWSIGIFFVFRVNKLMNKQLIFVPFETPSRRCDLTEIKLTIDTIARTYGVGIWDAYFDDFILYFVLDLLFWNRVVLKCYNGDLIYFSRKNYVISNFVNVLEGLSYTFYNNMHKDTQ